MSQEFPFRQAGSEDNEEKVTIYFGLIWREEELCFHYSCQGFYTTNCLSSFSLANLVIHQTTKNLSSIKLNLYLLVNRKQFETS